METRFTSGTMKLMAISWLKGGDQKLHDSWLKDLAAGEFLGFLELLVEVAAEEGDIGDGEWQGRRLVLRKEVFIG
jgi:hypothetical protein